MFNNKAKTILLLAFFVTVSAVFLFFSQGAAEAQTADFGTNYGRNLGIGEGDEDPRDVIVKIILIILTFLGIIATVIVLYAGYLWMSSQGDPEKVGRAKKTLINAIIGMILIMCSFLIVSWVFNNMGPGGGQSGPPTRPSFARGYGAIGACAINSVYPEPGQTDVSRNASLIATFKEDIDPSTVCNDSNSSGTYCDCVGANCDMAITTGADPAIRIFHRNERDSCLSGGPCNSEVSDLMAITNDNRTLVFIPSTLLGSASEYIWYSVYMSNAISNSDGRNIFASCRNDYFIWDFEISNRIDLTPPQVVSGGVFPAPDNEQDTFIETTATRASGDVVVVSQPAPMVLATITINPPLNGLEIVSFNENHDQSGTLTMAVEADAVTVTLSGPDGPLGSGIINANDTIAFAGLFTARFTAGYTAGQSWTLTATPFEEPDYLIIGPTTYIFVPNGTSDLEVNQIPLGASLGATASNITQVINGTPESPPNSVVMAAFTGNTITLTARTAGSSGNRIRVISGSSGLNVPLTGFLDGGADAGVSVTVNDRRDKPRNSAIQVNFNEAIMPTTISGPSDEVSDYIRVINNDTGEVLSGNFLISNVYRTVEFVSDDLCGINGCGEEIYCLPGNSNLRVELVAANLQACGNDADCIPRAPFSVCVGGYCNNNTTGENYPSASLAMDGIMDASRNSLDGNRARGAEGLAAFYNENASSAAGDSYLWSFYISDVLDLEPPAISQIQPTYDAAGILETEPITIMFNKVMLSSSLSTGSRNVNTGNGVVTHKSMNIWNLNNAAVGYWIASEGIDDEPPGGDNEIDRTQAEIRHTSFPDNLSIRAQVGSGVRDVYQNCYKPSSGPGCLASDITPSCCDGASTDILDSQGNCP